MTQNFKVRFEGPHGHLLTYHTALSELGAYLLPGYFPLWENSPTGEDVLSMLSPELVETYRGLVSRESR
jgi:hypothetical protein